MDMINHAGASLKTTCTAKGQGRRVGTFAVRRVTPSVTLNL